MSLPVWLTFSRSRTLISSVAKGFKCFALASGIVRLPKTDPPWLEGADWKEAVGEVEKFKLWEASWWEFMSLADVAIFEGIRWWRRMNTDVKGRRCVSKEHRFIEQQSSEWQKKGLSFMSSGTGLAQRCSTFPETSHGVIFCLSHHMEKQLRRGKQGRGRSIAPIRSSHNFFQSPPGPQISIRYEVYVVLLLSPFQDG